MRKFLLFFTLITSSLIAVPNAPIDVVIPCTEKDLPTLEYAIQGIKKHGKDIRRVIVISRNKLTESAEWYPEDNFPITKDDVLRVLFQNDKERVKYLKNPKNRLGWMYQQLLKFYAPFVIPDISENVLILDSDTVFLRDVSFLDHEGRALFNPGTEYTKEYFVHMSHVLPSLKRIDSKTSGISHHMLFEKPVLNSLFAEVENLHSKPFWEVVIGKIDPKLIFSSPFSEYEMYFSYAMQSSQAVDQVRHLKWSNINHLNFDKYQSRGYHYVSSHAWARVKVSSKTKSK